MSLPYGLNTHPVSAAQLSTQIPHGQDAGMNHFKRDPYPIPQVLRPLLFTQIAGQITLSAGD